MRTRIILTLVFLLTLSAAVGGAAFGAVPALRNPDRGFRFEIRIGLEEGEPYPAHLASAWPFGDYAREDGITLARAYCYLDRYAQTDLPPSKLAALARDLARARQDGVKLLLRFAYERTNQNACPELPLLHRHLDRLLPLVREQADILHVFDVGIIGRFGEFHHCTRGYEKNPQAVTSVVAKVLSVLPAEVPIAMRYPSTREWVIGLLGLDEVARRRIGWHNDGTLATYSDGGTFRADPHGMRGNPVYDQIARESAGYPVEGELYWTNAREVQPRANAIEAIRRMQDHHYTAFSIQHGWSGLDRHQGLHAIDAWMKTPVTEEMLAAYAIAPDREYFARYPTVSGFEYIRDHLGYRLVAHGCRREGARLTVRLANHGFAAPIKAREAHVVIRRRAGEWIDLPTGFDCRELAADFRAREFSVTLPDDTEDARFYLWLPDASPRLKERAEYAIRLANVTPQLVGGRLLNPL